MSALPLLLLAGLAAAEPRVRVIERPSTPRQESAPPSAPAPAASPSPAPQAAPPERGRVRVVPRSGVPAGPTGGSPAAAPSFQYEPRSSGGGPAVRVVPGQALRPQGSTRFVRYVDPYGYPWYGYWGASSYYWMRWHDDYWWWRDPHDRWVYWDRGSWWYPGPAGVVVVQQQGAPEPPAPTPKGGSFRSPDGRRLVEVTGERDDAFLYDNSGTHPVYLKTLASGVERVRFSGGAGGRPLRILLDLKDGAFELFDEEGRPVDEGRRPLPAKDKAPEPPKGEPPKVPPQQ